MQIQYKIQHRTVLNSSVALVEPVLGSSHATRVGLRRAVIVMLDCRRSVYKSVSESGPFSMRRLEHARVSVTIKALPSDASPRLVLCDWPWVGHTTISVKNPISGLHVWVVRDSHLLTSILINLSSYTPHNHYFSDVMYCTEKTSSASTYLLTILWTNNIERRS